MTDEEKLERAEEILGHTFDDRDLLRKALTHPSAVEGHAIADSYERLEFLGDAVLGAYISLYLYRKNPTMDEGDLTRAKTTIVSGGNLSEVAGALGVDQCIFLGDSELGTGNRGLKSALENVYEALVGALYLDGGRLSAERFMTRTLLADPLEPGDFADPSPKSRLQELTQSKFKVSPDYILIGREGPAHEPTFTSEVRVGSRKLGVGVGSSKKEAEKEAAIAALEVLEAEFAG